MDRKNHKNTSLDDTDKPETNTNCKLDNKTKVGSNRSKLIDEELKPISYFGLFRFLTPKDKVWLGIAVLSTFIASSCFLVRNILFAQMTEIIINSKMEKTDCHKNLSMIALTSPVRENESGTLMTLMEKFAIYMVLVGVVKFITGYLFISIFYRLAEIQMHRLRKEYFKALLMQNIGWYDTVEDRDFVAKMSENITKIQEAIANKAGMFLFHCFNCIILLVSSFWYGWLLTLVILPISPIIVISAVTLSYIQRKLSVKEQKAYSKAGMVAQEALSNIRTVMAFSGQQKENKLFESELVYAQNAGRKRGIVSAFGNGCFWFVTYACTSLAFWYGTKLIFDGRRDACTKSQEYQIAVVMTILFNSTTVAYQFGLALPYLEVFSVGRCAAAFIYNVIDMKKNFENNSKSGICLNGRLNGKIEFKNVQFSYPSRNHVKVLDGVNFLLQPGTKVALVGSSGCGKTTCLQLLQRLYDLDKGSILVDDVNITDLNVKWYRNQVGFVNQEPVLFNTTISNNIGYGKQGATQSEIEEACKLANAHDFISKLPLKYNTVVGECGSQLSGGQKQRIAIARAMIRNPSILVLDEATSALDTNSESLVQDALDRASKGRTTLIVAHRLSTVKKADVILSLQNGKIAEMGSHNSLMENKGLYYKLITYQACDHIPIEEHNCTENSENMSHELTEKQFSPQATLPHNFNQQENHLSEEPMISLLFRKTSKEWHWWAIGFLFSILQGGIHPLYSYFYGQIIGSLSISEEEVAQQEVNVNLINVLAVGIYAGVTTVIGLSCFSISGEALTNRLRKDSFRAMLMQDVSWFDSPQNEVGGLCARLSGDAASVQGATGNILGIVVQAISTIVISIGLGLYVSPKLGAVAFFFTSFTFIAGIYSGNHLQNQQIDERIAIEKSSTFAFEAVSSIRTVICLGKERDFEKMYNQGLAYPHKKAVMYSHLMGFVYGFSRAQLYFAYAAIYYYGAYLILKDNVEYSNVFVIIDAVFWSMLMVGQALSFTPNYIKAKVACDRIQNLFDIKAAIQCTPETGLQIKSRDRSVIFDNVEFNYPERKDAKVLKSLTLAIQPNTHVGICGPSGSGKSTIIQLLLRFYDATSGKLMYDGTDITRLDMDAYRSQLAVVAQEPALFDRSLADNIAYGDNTRNVSMDEIIEAARSSNIHSFIASLPSGYSTRVGDMGAQLSGGQKQRVAIARALVRKPKLLLLDEATAALDAETEKIVQLDLDNASQGRTCVTIAHRLSTFRFVDNILVIVEGELREFGTHAHLLKQKGVYYKLWNAQNYEKNSN